MKLSDLNPEYLKRHGIEAPKARSKYGAIKTEYNGVVYDSKLEAHCAAQLDRLQAVGLVTRWERQVRFDLEADLVYVCDFYVTYRAGNPRTIDAKGYLTREFRLKRRLFERRHGPLDVVKRWQDMPTEGRS